MRTPPLWILLAPALVVGGCRHTQPGTHVEMVEKGGQNVYVAGAAAPGTNKSIACRGAVARAVAAISLRFAQEHSDEADAVAEAVGASDGQVFMERYAKDDALSAAVQDLEFDPGQHLCMATVRWTPPIFVKDAVLKYAEKLKQEEMGGGASASVAPPAAGQPATSTAPTAPAAPPPAAVSVAPPAPAPAPAAAAPACARAKTELARVLKDNQRSIDQLEECLRRTQNDATICHRYQLYVDEAREKEAAAGGALADCLNAGLSTTIRMSLSKNLPGHAAVSVETRGDGTLVLWTFSPVDQTAFAYEMAPDGAAAGRSALAANQVTWVKQQLGL